MTKAVVDLIWNTSIQDLPRWRKMLRSSLQNAECPPFWHEWQMGSCNYPNRLKKFSTPGIIVNGKVAAKFSETLTCDELTSTIKRLRSRKAPILLAGLANSIQTFLMLAVIFFPKCPICWLAYANVFSQIGIQVPFTPELTYLFVGASLLCVSYLFIRWKSTGLAPPLMMLAALVLIVMNKYLLSDIWVVSVIAILLSITSAFAIVVQKGKQSRLLIERIWR